MYWKKLPVIVVLFAVLLSHFDPTPSFADPIPTPSPTEAGSPLDQAGVDDAASQTAQDLPYKFFLPFVAVTSCDHKIGPRISVADGRANYAAVKPGDRVCILAGTRNGLTLRNFEGTAGRPITFINFGGQVIIRSTTYYGIRIHNSRFFHLTGNGDRNARYGIIITNASSVGIDIRDKSSDFEIDHIEIADVGGGAAGIGILAKTNAVCSDGSTNEYDFDRDGTIRGDPDDVVNRNNFTQYNSILHDNYVHGVGTEGFYIGSSFYLGKKLQCSSGTETVYAPLLKGVHIYNNVVANTGWDGIQAGSAVEDCSIHHNQVYYSGQAQRLEQEYGIINTRGSVCHIYNNLVKNGGGAGIYVHGNGGNRIYNNLIVDPGQHKPAGGNHYGHGIILATGSNRGNSIYVFNNTIIRPRNFGIAFHNERGTDNRIQNNIVVDPGSYVTHGKDAYIRTEGLTNVTVSHNLTTRDISYVRFADPTSNNYSILSGSPAVDSGVNSCSAVVSRDYVGTARPQGSNFDIGAYELVQPH